MVIEKKHYTSTSCKAIVKPFNKAFGTKGTNGGKDGWICEETNPPYPKNSPYIEYILAFTVRSSARRSQTAYRKKHISHFVVVKYVGAPHTPLRINFNQITILFCVCSDVCHLLAGICVFRMFC
jgi:hypothetical protein